MQLSSFALFAGFQTTTRTLLAAGMNGQVMLLDLFQQGVFTGTSQQSVHPFL